MTFFMMLQDFVKFLGLPEMTARKLCVEERLKERSWQRSGMYQVLPLGLIFSEETDKDETK
jgi:hypothetical protein